MNAPYFVDYLSKGVKSTQFKRLVKTRKKVVSINSNQRISWEIPCLPGLNLSVTLAVAQKKKMIHKFVAHDQYDFVWNDFCQSCWFFFCSFSVLWFLFFFLTIFILPSSVNSSTNQSKELSHLEIFLFEKGTLGCASLIETANQAGLDNFGDFLLLPLVRYAYKLKFFFSIIKPKWNECRNFL